MFKRFCTTLCLVALLQSALFVFAQDQPAGSGAGLTQDATVIPEGTEIQLSLRDQLSSKLSEVGDDVVAVVRRDVVVDGRTVLQQGTEIIGRVTLAQPAGKMFKGGRLHVAFERIRLASGERRLTAVVKSASDFSRDEKIKSDGEGTLKGGQDGGKLLQNVGTAAGIGGIAVTIILLAGAAGDDGYGYGYGYGSGGSAAAAAGVLGGSVIAGVLLTKGKEVRLDQDTIVRLKLAKPLSIER